MNRSIAIVAFAVLAASGVSSQNIEIEPRAGAERIAAAAETPSFPRSGIASWYGPEFEGKPTASGERFDSSLLTAAHPTLPFGTLLRVTNTQNGRGVTVRVNDRGPFVAARIIDLSRAAAEKIDMIVTGTAPITLEIVGAAAGGESARPSRVSTISAPGPAAPAAEEVPASTRARDTAASAPAAPTAETAAMRQEPLPTGRATPTRKSAVLIPQTPDLSSGKRYRLQVGSYKIERNAAEAFQRLTAAGFAPSYEHEGELYRIVLVSVPAADVGNYARRLGDAGFSQALVREER